MSKVGVYPISTVENSKAQRFSITRSRFVDHERYKKDIPGPGQYQQEDLLTGSYLISNFKSYGTNKYRPPSLLKQRESRNNTPGPGTYQPPSEFGYL